MGGAGSGGLDPLFERRKARGIRSLRRIAMSQRFHIGRLCCDRFGCCCTRAAISLIRRCISVFILPSWSALQVWLSGHPKGPQNNLVRSLNALGGVLALPVRRARQMPVSASRTGRTLAARLPLNARAMSRAARGSGEAKRMDWTAPICPDRSFGQGITLSGNGTAASSRSSVSLIGAR